MKFKTVREGEQAILYNYMGEGKLLTGPRRVFLFRDRLEMIERRTASQYEYLELKDKAGNITVKAGPCEMFRNPLELSSLQVKDAIRIDSHHVVVVYRNDGKTVQRRIIEGPTTFIPAADEWIHVFEWHGQDQNEADHMIRAGRRITQLPLMPEHFSDKVNEVRTLDDTKMVVKLVVFYELVDVLKMLEETSDPIADMMNAMCADVIQFAGNLTFKDFVAQSNKLNSLDSYTQLLQRGSKVGYQINKVVYRGYTVSLMIQDLHDKNIENRTRMKLQQEVQAVEQKLKDFEITKEQDRIAQKNKVANLEQAHSQERENLIDSHEREITSAEHEHDLAMNNLKQQCDVDIQKIKKAQQISHMEKLKSLGVDLSTYLKTKQPQLCNEMIIIGK